MRSLALLLFASAASAFAADVTGDWSVDGKLNGNAISIDCTFHQNEKKLTGSCKAYQFSAEITGSVEEDVVRFSYTYNFAGVPYVCNYTGKLTGSEFRGTIVASGIDGVNGEFVAKKS